MFLLLRADENLNLLIQKAWVNDCGVSDTEQKSWNQYEKSYFLQVLRVWGAAERGAEDLRYTVSSDTQGWVGYRFQLANCLLCKLKDLSETPKHMKEKKKSVLVASSKNSKTHKEK